MARYALISSIFGIGYSENFTCQAESLAADRPVPHNMSRAQYKNLILPRRSRKSKRRK